MFSVMSCSYNRISAYNKYSMDSCILIYFYIYRCIYIYDIMYEMFLVFYMQETMRNFFVSILQKLVRICTMNSTMTGRAAGSVSF